MPHTQNVITDELSKRLADSFGGPLSTNDIERDKNNPHSQLNRIAATVATEVVNNEIAAIWSRIVKWIEQLRRDVSEGVKAKVADVDDAFIDMTTRSVPQTTEPGLKAIPQGLVLLLKSLQQLQLNFLGCCLQLAANQVTQRNAFNQALAQIPNHRELGLRPLAETDDAVLSKMYETTRKNIEIVARPEDKQQPGRMDAQALLNFELKFARYVSATNVEDEDAILDPKMIMQARAAFKGYLQYVQENYRIQQEQQAITIQMIMLQVQIVQGFPRDLIQDQMNSRGAPNPFNTRPTPFGGNGR